MWMDCVAVTICILPGHQGIWPEKEPQNPTVRDESSVNFMSEKSEGYMCCGMSVKLR